MTGTRFKVMMVLIKPFFGKLEDYLASNENTSIDSLNRFHYRLVQHCRDYYNFTIDLSLTKSWGYLLPNGSFEGMVGALERRVVDFAGVAISLREDRIKIVDYGRHTWGFNTGFIFRSPKSRTSLEILFKPFSTWIWIISAVFGAVSIVILKMVTRFERHRNRGRTETSWSLSFLFTLGAFCQQGFSSVPKMTCGRITTITIFLLSTFLFQFYSASIVSNLLMKPSEKINNMNDLLHSNFKAGAEDVIYLRDFFKRTTDKTIKEFYAKKLVGKKKNVTYLLPEDGLRLVQKGDYAFHVETSRAYPIIRKTFSDEAICELREIKIMTFSNLFTLIPKGSPFKDMMETCFQRIDEVGIMVREQMHWDAKKPECIQKTFVSLRVGIAEFYPVLVILAIGYVLSLLILIVERWIHMVKYEWELNNAVMGYLE